jgi:hypothetical protein
MGCVGPLSAGSSRRAAGTSGMDGMCRRKSARIDSENSASSGSTRRKWRLLGRKRDHGTVSAARDLIRQVTKRGVKLSATGSKLRCVGPVGAITPELRVALERNKPEIIKALSREAPADEFRAAIQLGCLHLCVNCKAFSARAGSRPDGWCCRFSVETWAELPLRCDGYEPTH